MFLKSFSKEFLKHVKTKYASYIILLKRMIEVQEALHAMVVCVDWGRWLEAKTNEGKKVKQMALSDHWLGGVKYGVSFVATVMEVIRYVDTNSPSLREIYETIDSIIGRMEAIIQEKDSTLDLYDTHILPIVQHRWDKMNTPLHMPAYALNPKWYVMRPGRVAPIYDIEVKKGSMNVVTKMYSEAMSSNS